LKSSIPILCLVVAGLAGCGGGGASDVIAKVNGKAISREQYLKQLETMDTVAVTLEDGRTVNARPAQPLSSQALGNLIEKQIIIEAATKEKCMPSNDDVEKEKALRASLNPDFYNAMKRIGLSIEDINQSLLIELARYNLAVRGVPQKTIKDAEDYVAANPKQFEQPPTVTFRWIVVNTPAEQAEVDKDLKGGLTFGATAAKHSIVPAAKTNNGAFNSGESPTPRPAPLTEALGKELYAAAKETPAGQRSKWISVQGKLVLLDIQSKTPAAQLQPKPGQLELLRRALTEQDARGTNDLGKLLLDTLMVANVQVTPPYLKKNWEAAMVQLKARTMELGKAENPIAPKPSGK
jgi:parvulin-like peptidyl-prolyl isomerase